MKPNKPARNFLKMVNNAMVLVRCWASQSSTQPTQAQILGWGFNPTQAMVALSASASTWVKSDPPYQFLVNTPW